MCTHNDATWNIEKGPYFNSEYEAVGYDGTCDECGADLFERHEAVSILEKDTGNVVETY